jgi:16S rRNA (guanine966-N2)-methyltransferase
MSGRIRIIGGQWRGRKLSVPDSAGLRPTGDRARETLFNWLQAQVPGARCLDLFAGTGALGLEALSRGAASSVFVERDRRLVEGLQGRVLEGLADGGHLAAGARVYVEQDARDPEIDPGERYELLRSKTMGEVRLTLLSFS